MKNIEAILFDFDGVIADTMEDNLLAWTMAFRDKGIEIKREDYMPLEGMKLVEVARTISKKYGLKSIDPLEIVKLKGKYYLENHSFSFYKEVKEILESLQGNKKLAIVTASPREKLEKTVSKEFLERFDYVVSGDDTTKGKPSPEPYLTAMRKLGVQPENCVVVENAPLGIKSAKAAGAYCIALTTTLDEKYLQEADRIVKNHAELSNVLSEF